MIYSANSNSYFFLLSSLFLMIFFKTLPMFKLCLQHFTLVTNDTTWVCAGVHRCAHVCIGVRECVRVWWVCSCVCKCAQVCVRDEFSEYLLETRFLTSANYSTHPLRIFYSLILEYMLTSCIFEDTVEKVRIVVNTTKALSETLSISK